MRKFVFTTLVLLVITGCNQPASTTANMNNASLNKMFDNYYEDRMKLYPIEALKTGTTGIMTNYQFI